MVDRKPFFDHGETQAVVLEPQLKDLPQPETPMLSENAESDFDLFQSEIGAMFSDMSTETAAKLFQEFKSEKNRLMLAANAYLDRPGEYTDAQPEQGKRTASKASAGASEDWDGEKRQKRGDSNESWSRYVGTTQVNCWCTRYVFGGLREGDRLHLSKNPENNRIVYVNTMERAPDGRTRTREIGRVNESVAKVLAPLLAENDVELDVYVAYLADTRLRTGDTFVVKMDAFLTQQAFFESSSETGGAVLDSLLAARQRRSGAGLGAGAGSGADSGERRDCLSAFFELLRVSKIEEEPAMVDLEGEEENLEGEDLDDVQRAWEAAQRGEGEENGGPSPLKSDDSLTLNQLKNLYRSTETDSSELPETYPDDFALELRPYQRQGLSWMLRREGEYSQIGANNAAVGEDERVRLAELSKTAEGFVVPLWKEYKWPTTGESENGSFFFNIYTGSCSHHRPLIRSTCAGGILADEMGLGKTITTLGLVLSCPSDTGIKSAAATRRERYAHSTTLIVVPMTLLSQWESEFAKARGSATKNSRKCYIYYGSDTLGDLTTLLCGNTAAPTVVLTTYGTVQSEWARCSRTGSTVGLFSVKFFRVVLDEGHQIRNRAAKTTRAVCSLDASRRWVLTGTPVVNRLDDLYSLISFLDVQPWKRHSLWKNFVTDPFDTGRGVRQAFGLLKSVLDPLLLRRTKNQRDREGNLLVSLPTKEVTIERLKFNEKEEAMYDWLKARAANTFEQNLRSGLLLKNYSSILTHLLRLRQVCCHMDLVRAPTEETDEDAGSRSEQRVLSSSTLDSEAVALLEKLDEQEKQEKLPTDQMLALKDAIYATYPRFIDEECSICTGPVEVETCVITECKHCFCLGCLMEHFRFQERRAPDSAVLCPVCRGEIKKTRLFRTLPVHFRESSTDEDESILATQVCGDQRSYFVRPFSPYGKSSKINALVSHLHQIREENPNDHVIVFSQFTSFLDLVQQELAKSESEFKVHKFDGRLNVEQRQKVLSAFTNDKPDNRVSILLLSLKAGGVGLNLTVASKAFLLDPHWNNAVEFQAIDRIHRVGQTKNVKVIRFIMENSIEERMLKIQERKNQLGEALAMNDEERRKRRIEEIEMLFETNGERTTSE